MAGTYLPYLPIPLTLRFQIGSGAHPSSYPVVMGGGVSFL
jgi:hypothetical protein